MFLAEVCPQPDTVSSGSARALKYGLKYDQPHHRELWWSPWKWWGYYFLGGGGCRGCDYDNNDRRDLQFGAVVGTTEWFQETFVPQTESKLEFAIVNDLVPNHKVCLGVDPTIHVTLIAVDFDSLNIHCDDGTFIEELTTVNLADIAFTEQDCGLCYSLDFSTKGDGTPLSKGDYVQDEWKELHGLTITASGGLNKARIFDTADTVCTNAAGRNDFGSPNKACDIGGIGEGGGGAPGQPGENCVPLESKYCSLCV